MRITTLPFSLRSSTAASFAGLLMLSACDPADGTDPAWHEAQIVADEAESDDIDVDPSDSPMPTVGDLSSEQPAGGYIAGTMVARVDVAPGHFVQFWELEPGVVGIRESIAVDEVDDPTPTLEGFDEPSATVLDAYRVIVPDATDDEIPRALREAHERAVARDAMQAELALTGQRPTPSTAASPGDGAPGAVTSEPDVQADCSPDVYGDTWGRQWFFDNFCNVGAFRTCEGNMISANTVLEETSWWMTYGMAADFYVPARMHGGHWYHADFCVFFFVCTDEWYFIGDFDYPIQPRYVEGWTYLSGDYGWREGHVDGDPGCPRVHMAYLRNK